MTRRRNQLGLICASLILSASDAWAVPNCPDDPNEFWSDCVGNYTNAKGDTCVTEFKDGKRHGHGTLTSADGTIEEGVWENDVLKYSSEVGPLVLVNGDGVETPLVLSSDEEEPLTVTITAEGVIFIKKTEVQLAELVTRLRAIAAERTSNKIYLRADGANTWSRVAEVMSALNAGGFFDIGLVTGIGDPAAPAPVPDTSDAVADALAAAVAASAAPAVQAGPIMTLSERDSFRIAVNSCWNVDPESVAARVIIEVGLTLTREGLVEGEPRLLSSSSSDQSATSEAFMAARRAILRCQQSGYQLPADKYDLWREVTITFDPTGLRLR